MQPNRVQTAFNTIVPPNVVPSNIVALPGFRLIPLQSPSNLIFSLVNP